MIHPRIELGSQISVTEQPGVKSTKGSCRGRPGLPRIPGLEADLLLVSFPLTPEGSQRLGCTTWRFFFFLSFLPPPLPFSPLPFPPVAV